MGICGNLLGTSWELEKSHGNVVVTWRVPWEVCGNFIGLMGTCGNFVGRSLELHGNPMGSCEKFVRTSW